MAAPSNIRINPFIGDGGTTNYVDFTEVHIIPAVSPFVVRLNEVPQKKDPSNMKVVYVDETTGAPTTTVLTEVAATPGAGEFRPDYSTNADGDEDWNTGLIEFSSADAGKSIQVSYTGMGTLAGVKNNRFPAWWLDRGDGSDGDFRPTGNTTISGRKQYRSVFIPAGVTVTIDQFTRLCCQGAFINFGIVSAEGAAKNGVGGGVSPNIGNIGTGGGNGGAGGYSGAAGGSGSLINGISIPSVSLVWQNEGLGFGASGGSGRGNSNVNGAWANGGAGGSGGGAIIVRCNSFDNRGTLNANGGRGGNATGDTFRGGGGGGGGGGSITVIAHSIVNRGTVLANGGSGGSGYAGGSAGAAGTSGVIQIFELGVM